METNTLIAVVVVAVIVAAYAMWHRASERLYFPGGKIALEATDDYKFVYIASFTTEDGARSSIKATEPLAVESKVFPPSQYQHSWSVHWELVSKPDGKHVRALEAKITAIVSNRGGRFVDLAVSKPGATMSVDAG